MNCPLAWVIGFLKTARFNSVALSDKTIHYPAASSIDGLKFKLTGYNVALPARLLQQQPLLLIVTSLNRYRVSIIQNNQQSSAVLRQEEGLTYVMLIRLDNAAADCPTSNL